MKFDLADLNKYYSPEDIKDYEAFIGPDGEYYKVKTRYESADNLTHYKWAEEYIRRKGMENFVEKEKIASKCKTPLEFLVNYLGFIRYTHAHASTRKVYLTVPNPMLFGKKINKEQIDSLYKLMEYNKDDITYEIMELLEQHENESYFADNIFEIAKNGRS